MVRGSYIPIHSNGEFNHTPRSSRSYECIAERDQDYNRCGTYFLHTCTSAKSLCPIDTRESQSSSDECIQPIRYNYSISTPVHLNNNAPYIHIHHDRVSDGLRFTPVSSASAGLAPNTTSINPPPQTCLNASLTLPVLGCIPTSNT